MTRRRREMSLDEDADQILRQVGNASAYVSELVREHARQWTDAHATLVAAGWTPPQLRAAADALNGYWLVGSGRAPSYVAAELHDAARLADLCERHDIPPATWQERVQQVADQPEVAEALVVLVREYWVGNAAVEARIDG